MAIVFNSLTPLSPSVSSGNSVTFTVDVTETESNPVTYTWQYSTDGVNYTSSGLIGNTNSTYTTSNLTSAQNGIYFRVAVSNGVDTVFSNEDPFIGDRIITVFEDPIIVTMVNNLVDYYPSSQTVSVNEIFSFTVSASLSNADITNTTLISQISIQWQYSIDDGSNWIAINNGGDFSIVETIDLLDTSPNQYYKYSTLQISNINFSDNLNRYRAVITFSGASNTPVIRPEILLLVDPQITIIRQPGEGNDTLQSRCYKTSDNTSGFIKVETSALSSANTTITYEWQANLGDGFWAPITDLVNNYICFLKSGTTSTSNILELERVIFYNEIELRCVIGGVSGEPSVITNVHTVYMTDVQVDPIVDTLTVNTIEDKYGNVENRDILLDSFVRNANILISLNTARNTGINGDITSIYERKDPGSNIWYEVGEEFFVETSNNIEAYTPFPVNTSNLNDYYYTTPPLRRDVDNGAKYRLKVSSSAIYSLNNGVKTILPYYSDEITLNVFRTVYITNQPANATAFANASSSFSVSATPSSGALGDISYQWQYNLNNTTTGWTNIPNTNPYSGVNTNLLIINPVQTNNLYRYYRCVISITNQLSSVTTNVAQLNIQRDFFTQISSINDSYLNEGQNFTFSVTASSLSQGQISYQWQKSTDYNPALQSGTWINISGETSNILNFPSLVVSDSAYYRLKLTSFGGEIQYTNVARLGVTSLQISIVENTPTSIVVTEGDPGAYSFRCRGISSIGSLVSYQWQISTPSNPTFTNIGNGLNNSSDTNSEYLPQPFTRENSLCKIRCKITAEGIPNPVYTNETVVTVKRIFYYFADVSNKVVTNGNSLFFDLNPFWTGGTPTFSWEYSSNGGSSWVTMNETDSVLLIPSIDATFNNRQYRCQITLANCDEHIYSRSNSTVVVSASNVFPTVVVTVNVVSSISKPSFYSIETQKSGASIGTVICVAKPPDYVENPTSNADDIGRWKVAVSGSLTTSNVSSVVTSGAVFNANKPSWATSYSSPRWRLDNDRYAGYLEMRGQYLRASEFPELARMLGTTYGGTITGTYPSYNSTDIFRLPNLYAKRLLGTGNVDNNRGSVSITPLYNPNETSGGDKNIPGTIGGRYNYERSAQLPPGSPGVSGLPDGTAGVTDPETYTIGSFRSSGFEDVNTFLQPTMSGTVTYVTDAPVESFTDTPQHTHTAVSAGWRRSQGIVGGGCFANYPSLAGDTFVATQPDGGTLEQGPHGTDGGQSHGHGVRNGNGTFDMVRDAGMNISDTTLRMTNASRTILDNSLEFFLRNNEEIPLNSPYFRLKYLIKAY